jgi:uncharacterized protein
MISRELEKARGPLAEFCRRNHIQRLAVFGSALGDQFRPDSDIDLLAEFEAGHVPGWDFFSMQDELSKLLGRKVDLNTPRFLSRYFRDQVQNEAVILYEKDRGSPPASHA